VVAFAVSAVVILGSGFLRTHELYAEALPDRAVHRSSPELHRYGPAVTKPPRRHLLLDECRMSEHPECAPGRTKPQRLSAPRLTLRWLTRRMLATAGRPTSGASWKGWFAKPMSPLSSAKARPTLGSLDGDGAADHDQPYRFGSCPRASAPYPFNTRQYARLLVLRGRIQDRIGASLELIPVAVGSRVVRPAA
jgi:hypothetical protein